MLFPVTGGVKMVKIRFIAGMLLALFVLGFVPAAARAADKVATVEGIVAGYSARDHRLAITDDAGQRTGFVWGAETRFSGVVADGVKVNIRYTTSADGTKVAQAVSVLK